MALSAGTVLGHYRIVSILGSGGMGEVYSAEDTRLHRRIAIKLLPSSVTADPERRARFEREARTIAALNHPNIVTIYAVEQAGDVPFLAMELVEGKPLAEMIPRRGLPLDTMLKLAIPLADAISAAHQRGITHRDLKPANVMVTPDGRVKVLDFGLAKLNEAEPEAMALTTFTAEALTGEGRIIGTAAYMSPEQAEGKPIDHRTDIFSLGIVLYEMATGERPFKGDTAVSILSSIVKDTPPSVTEVNQQLPRDLGRIVRRALIKDAERRYQSAKDLRNDLEELKQALESGELAAVQPTAPALQLQPWIWGVGVMLAAAVVVAVWLAGRGNSDAPPAPPATRVEFSTTKVTSQPGIEQFPSLSPDGRWIIYSAKGERNADIYLHAVGGQTPINLTKDSPADDSQPAFSKDGERIVFRSERDGGGLFVMGRTGESVTRLTDTGFNPAWSPDGTEVAYAEEETETGLSRNASHLWVVALASGARRRLTDGDGVQPSWSPHGQRIAYWAAAGSSRVRDIWTLPASGGQPLQVTNDPAMDWNPVWSPDGKYLYFLSDRGGSMNLWRVSIDESTGHPLSVAEAITTPSPSVAHITLSGDGTRLVFASIIKSSNVQKLAFDPVTGTASGNPVPITTGTRLWELPHPSPDGLWITVQSGPPQEDIFVVRTDGSGLRQLTNDRPADRGPAWSPDGSRIAFYSNRSGNMQIWTIKPDGSDLRQLTNHSGNGLLLPQWSPDGSRVATMLQIPPRIVLFDPRKAWSDQQAEELPPYDDVKGAISPRSWSPDGRKLAIHDRVGGIIVYSFDSRRFERFTDSGLFPNWLSDSRRLLFTARNGDLMLLDTASRTSRVVLSGYPDAVRIPRVSNDNRQVVFTREGGEGDIYMLAFK